MKYQLIHLDLGVIAESNDKFILKDLKVLYITKGVPAHLLSVVYKKS